MFDGVPDDALTGDVAPPTVRVQPSRHPEIPPPPALEMLIDVLGVDDTLRLVEAFGGTKFWVPKGVDNSSRQLRMDLEAQFGKAMTRELIRGYGGGKLSVPLVKNWRIQLYAASGMKPVHIARRLLCNIGVVRHVLGLRNSPDLPGVRNRVAKARRFRLGARAIRKSGP